MKIKKQLINKWWYSPSTTIQQKHHSSNPNNTTWVVPYHQIQLFFFRKKTNKQLTSDRLPINNNPTKNTIYHQPSNNTWSCIINPAMKKAINRQVVILYHQLNQQVMDGSVPSIQSGKKKKEATNQQVIAFPPPNTPFIKIQARIAMGFEPSFQISKTKRSHFHQIFTTKTTNAIKKRKRRRACWPGPLCRRACSRSGRVRRRRPRPAHNLPHHHLSPIILPPKSKRFPQQNYIRIYTKYPGNSISVSNDMFSSRICSYNLKGSHFVCYCACC